MINQFLKFKYGKDFYIKNIGDMKKESQKEIEQIENGVPMHKVLGHINIGGLKIMLNKNVLIPRYETEEVILEALKYISDGDKVLDLCTGSGFIALYIKNKVNVDIIASDISDDAIAQAKQNAMENQLNIKVVKSNLFDNINDKFDLIISNPPYIPNETPLSKSVTQYEPKEALFGGVDGNDFYKKIVEEYKKYLNTGGHLIFEISEDNLKYFQTLKCKIKKDINKKNRIVIIKN